MDFVSINGTLEALVEKRAWEMATEIVTRTFQTMKLESQEITDEQLKSAIEKRTAELKVLMPNFYGIKYELHQGANSFR